MDELDDDLFGKSSKKFSSSSKPGTPNKAVSFKRNSPVNDFDLDDPLAGILSDEESASRTKKFSTLDRKKQQITDINFDDDDDGPLGSMPMDDDNSKTKSSFLNQSKPSPKESNIKNTSAAKENLFDDDDDGMLDNLDLSDDKLKTKSNTPDDDFMSPLDKLLAKSSDDIPQKQSSSTRKFRFDKDGNLISDKSLNPNVGKPPIKPAEKPGADKEDLSFGAYLPSTSASRSLRSRPTSASKPDDDFLSFLNDDVGKSPMRTASVSNEVSRPSPSRTSGRRAGNADFLELGDEIDIDSSSDDSKKPPTSAPPKSEDDFLSFLTKDTSPSPNKKATSSLTGSRPSSGRTSGVRSRGLGVIERAEEIDIDSPSEETGKLPASPSLTKPDPTSTQKPIQSPLNQPLSAVGTQPSSFLPPKIPPLTTVTPPSELKLSDTLGNASASSFVPSASVPNRPTPKLFESAERNDRDEDFLREAKMTFNEDLNIAKQAYEDRILNLHAEVTEIKMRSDREVDAIKESYNMRMEMMRKQMKDQFEDVYQNDSSEQNEIKKLRALHLKALEDTRLDYESRINMMKDSHSKDIEAIKSSTGYVRNLEGMMRKVDGASEQLDSLSSKYESVFHGMTQRWNDMTAENKRFMSDVKLHIEEINQSNLNMQNNLQVIVSRLEGSMSEMSRAMRESQTQMQLERNRLESLQSSVESEKKQLLHQVASERSEAMNAHKEAIELRHTYERGMREDNDRLRQWQEYLLQSQRVLEEARSAEVKQTADRENEWRRIENHLARERSEVLEKTERLVSLEARLQVQKEELERKESALQMSEKRKLEKEEELRNREDELKIGEERATKKLEASRNVLEEAKRVEEEYEARLNDIKNDTNTLSRQRQLLAEERKHLIEDRITRQGADGLSADLSPLTTPRKRFAAAKINASTPSKAAAANGALWMFTAQKDREFLEDEKIFLDALKLSPYKNSDKTFYE